MAAEVRQRIQKPVYTAEEFFRSDMAETFLSSAQKSKAAASIFFYDPQRSVLYLSQQPSKPNKYGIEGLTPEDVEQSPNGFLRTVGGGVEQEDLGENALTTFYNIASREFVEEAGQIDSPITQKDLENAFFVPNAGFYSFSAPAVAIPVTDALIEKIENYEGSLEPGKTFKFFPVSIRQLHEAQSAKETEYHENFDQLISSVGSAVAQSKENLPDLIKAIKKDLKKNFSDLSEEQVGEYCVGRAKPELLGEEITNTYGDQIKSARAFYSSLVKVANTPPIIHFVARTADIFSKWHLERQVEPLEEKKA